MALTDTQKAEVRRALGWSARFHQFDSRLEQALSALDSEPEHELQITDSLINNGILANIDDIRTKIRDAHNRLKANTVGSIELNRQELHQLYRDGDRWVSELARILGVEVRNGGTFSRMKPTTFASFGGLSDSGNYVGK